MDRETLAAGFTATAAELREQLALVSAAAQLLERTAGSRERSYIATLNQSVCRMLRTVTRMELAHRLTDENEIRAFPAPMDLAVLAGGLAGPMESVLASAGIALTWNGPAELLLTGDRDLLGRMMLEMVSEAAETGNRIRITMSQQGDKAHITVAAEGDVPARPRIPEGLEEEEPLGISMIRMVAQLHGGTLVTCLEGGLYRSLTVILPQRLNLPAGQLESPRKEAALGGFDPVVVAFSHLLPEQEFLPED